MNPDKKRIGAVSRNNGVSDNNAEKYNKELIELHNFLEAMIDSGAFKSIELSKIKDVLNRVAVIAQEWQILPPEIQEKFTREDLLSKVLPLIRHENTPFKFRVIRTGLYVMRSVGFADYIFNARNTAFSMSRIEDDSSFVKYSDQEEVGQMTDLTLVLKNLAKLSREKENDEYFVQEGIFPFLMEIMETIVTLKQGPQSNLLILLMSSLKNIAGNEEIRKKALKLKNCEIFSNLLDYLNDLSQANNSNKNKGNEITKVVLQLSGFLRNLTTKPDCIEIFSQAGVLHSLFPAIEYNIQEVDTVLNCLRILSKMSLSKDCCVKIMHNEQNVPSLLKVLEIHRNGLAVVCRICFILANITTFIAEMREALYFDFEIFPQLFECFKFYMTKGSQDMEKLMRSSFTKFDKASGSENNLDAITKLVRLMANLFTLDKIGIDFVTKNGPQYKLLLQYLCAKLKEKEAESNTEFMISSLSFIANIMFFENQILKQEDFSLTTLKTEILFTLNRFIIQNNEEVCCEALRVLSNLSRDKNLARQTTKTKIVEAVIALLAHTNKDIVYYSLGIIMNLMVTDEMRKVETLQTILKAVTNILFYSTIEEFDIVSCCLKCTTNILDTLNKPDLDGNMMKDLEELIQNFGEQCDVLLSTAQNDENNRVGDLRAIINHLLNIMPEQGYNCPDKSCGRKFKSEEDLKKHVSRRHGK